MKKKFLLLLFLGVLFSCTNEDLNAIQGNIIDENQVNSRAVTSISSFNPLSEIGDIPVNIINVGNTNCSYLSSEENGTKVVLTNKDDETNRQRWYIKNEGTNIRLVGGNNLCNSWPQVYLGPNGPGETDPRLLTHFNNTPTMATTMNYLNSGYYHIGSIMTGMNPSVYLQSEKNNGKSLVFKSSNSTSNLSKWEVVPVGEFQIVDMEYEVGATDFIKRSDQIMDQIIIHNPSSTDYLKHTYSINKSVREKSSFSEAQGISTQKNSSLKFGLGIAVDKINIGVDGQINKNVTTTQTVTFGTEEEHSIMVQNSFEIPVPPLATYRIEVFMMSYNANATYIATLQKIDSPNMGKRFRIKGKWEGITANILFYNGYDVSTGELVMSKAIDDFTVK